MPKIWKWGIQNSKPPGLVGITSNLGSSIVYLSYIVYDDKKIPKIKAYLESPYRNLLEKKHIIQKFVTTYSLKGAHCSYVLAPNQYILTLIEAPKVTVAELPNAARWLMQDSVTFSIQDAQIDAFMLPVPRVNDNQNMAYGVAMANSVLKEIESEIEGSYLNLQYIDIPELVLRNVMQLHPQEANGSLLLNLYLEGCQMIFSRGGNFLLTRKINFSIMPLDDKKLEMIALEVQRSLDYFTTIFQQSIQSLILTIYDKEKFNDVENYLKQNLNVNVYRLELKQYLQWDSIVNIQTENVELLSIGAALRKQE